MWACGRIRGVTAGRLRRNAYYRPLPCPRRSCVGNHCNVTQTTARLRPVPPGYRTEMRTIDLGTSFTVVATAPTATFLRVRPSDADVMESSLILTDQFGTQHVTVTEPDWPNNGAARAQSVDRVVLPSGASTITYAATVAVPDVLDPMPADLHAPSAAETRPEHLWWLQPSRYCRPDELGQEAWERFGRDITPDRPATGATVRNICSFVNEEMAFAYGSTTPVTGATEAWAQRRGVCRDFNHVAASFCRALNIPTRYVFGYLPDLGVAASEAPMDFCAWIEVCLDDAWWTFDARVNEPRVGRIVVGRGRDAADVPMISTLGATLLTDFVVRASERLPQERSTP